MWHAKPTGSFGHLGTYGQDNATEMFTVFDEKGWCTEAIAAIIGNAEAEAGLNPWRWQSDDVPTLEEFDGWSDEEASLHGYGLPQFTPAKKYINNNIASAYGQYGWGANLADMPGLATDGNAQTHYMANLIPYDWSENLYNYYKREFDKIGVNIDDFYWMTIDEFLYGDGDYEFKDYVGAYLCKFERGNNEATAKSFANRVEYSEFWYDFFGGSKKMPIYFYLKQL